MNAQAPPEQAKPYAAMNRNAVYYAGAGAGTSHDLHGKNATIGMMLPLSGPLAADGRALLQAAQMAIDDEAKIPLPDGQRLALTVHDESGPWGQASNEIVHLIFEDNAIAIITSPEGNIAHQAEQIANKIDVPVLTLSSDATTTQINMPWIFRLGPSDEDEARAFAGEIYKTRGFRNVLLIAEADHDGRVGADEFEKAARELGAATLKRVDVAATPARVESVVGALKSTTAQAVVLWTDKEFATELIPSLRQAAPKIPIYLCRKAAEFTSIDGRAESASAHPEANGSEIWVSASRLGVTPAQRQFEKDFLARTGAKTTEADAAAYDAVRVIVSALRRAGANRVRVRDVLASGDRLQGVARTISFDTAGNEQGRLVIVALEASGNGSPF